MFSLILTTYNESDNIGPLLDDVIGQTRRPGEIVVIDGGSTDGTDHLIETRRAALEGAGIALRFRVEAGANIAVGRNLAIAEATYETLCVTDAGCRLEPDWCEKITSPILSGEADFVGGFYRAVHHGRFQQVLAALTVAATPPRDFLPSSRSVAFTREIWRRAGRYPERLPWGEDTLFDERCLQAGARYVVAADAVVHWEVRRTYQAAFLQFYRYAWGDGRRRRLSASHLVNLAVVVATPLAALAIDPWFLLVFPAYILLLLTRSSEGMKLADLPFAFSLVAGMRVCRSVGFVRGLISSCHESSVES